MAEHWLLVAGEASGDRLGEGLVRVLSEHGWGARGAGGVRMERAGLLPLVDFAELGVSGIVDVLTHLISLRRNLRVLRKALHNPECRGLVCIDYPGFNLRLMREADRLHKPVYWVAPPQIWAWKPERGKLFRGRSVAVFFPFEEKSYQQYHALVTRVAHPLLEEAKPSQACSSPPMVWALLPGSRLPQALRNLPALLRIGETLCAMKPGSRCILVMSDAHLAKSLLAHGYHGEVRLASEGEALWIDVCGAVCPPGTASLELALRGIPTVVFSRIDLLSFASGRLFLRIPYLALPNLLLKERMIPEYVGPACWGWPRKSLLERLSQDLIACDMQKTKTQSEALHSLLAGSALAYDFSQFIQRTK